MLRWRLFQFLIVLSSGKEADLLADHIKFYCYLVKNFLDLSQTNNIHNKLKMYTRWIFYDNVAYSWLNKGKHIFQNIYLLLSDLEWIIQDKIMMKQRIKQIELTLQRTPIRRMMIYKHRKWAWQIFFVPWTHHSMILLRF